MRDTTFPAYGNLTCVFTEDKMRYGESETLVKFAVLKVKKKKAEIVFWKEVEESERLNIRFIEC